MRKYTDVKYEISALSSEIDIKKTALKGASYIDSSDQKIVGFLTLIFLLVLPPLYMLVSFLTKSDGIVSGLGYILGIVWMGLYIAFYCSAVITFTADLSYTAAKNFLILYVFILAASVASFVLFQKHSLPENVFKVNGIFDKRPDGTIDKSTFPVYFINDKINGTVLRLWVFSVKSSLIPCALTTLALFIRFIKEILKKRGNNKSCAVIKKEIETAEDKLISLNSELYEIKSQADRAFRLEVKKESPDTGVILKAAQDGSAEAGLWLANDLASELLANRKNISENSFVSETEKARRYLEYAAEGPGGDLFDVLDIWTDFCSRKRRFSSYGYSKDVFEKLRKKSGRLTSLSKSSDAHIKAFADDICSDFNSGLYDYEQNLEYEEEKKRQAKVSTSYTPSYGGSSSRSAMTDSEMKDYLRHKMLNIYNPSVIDNDPNLTAEQKEQMKGYARTWGD